MEEKYEGVVGGRMVVKKVEYSVDFKVIEVCWEMVFGIEVYF